MINLINFGVITLEINEYISDLNLDKKTLINNELAFYADSNFKLYYDKYLYTANYVHELFEACGFTYCCVKAFRNYTHFNTDLNISVSNDDFNNIISKLESEGWSRRDPWSRFKEDISEYGKRKMVYPYNGRLNDPSNKIMGVSEGFTVNINENVYDNNDETNDNVLKSSKNGKCNTIKGNWIVLSLILIIMIMVLIIYNVV